jgi:hypothetical protein
MSPSRLMLTELTVTDGNLPPATVKFSPGLNLIIGASDTGKTFVFEAIDFMLGAKEGLRRIPESTGYTRVLLSIDPSDGPAVTLRRAFEGGQIEACEYANGRAEPTTATRVLGPTHTGDADTSLSAHLLHAIGLDGREVRKNARGEKRALSFRDICHLTLIGEERIIQQASPVLMGQVVSETAEGNVFALLLTGQDDSQIIPLENAKQRKVRLTTESNIVETILNEKRAELAGVSADSSDLADQGTRLDAAIDGASRVVVSSQEEITILENNRAALSKERTAKQSRLLFVEEQLKRLRLLDEYYETDRARLQTVIEASRVFHELPEGTCPLCNRPYVAGDNDNAPHGEFEGACRKEVEKIDVLRRDLGATITDFTGEEAELRKRLSDLATELRQLETQLQRMLMPAAHTAQADLQHLIQTRTAVAQGAALQATVRSFEERLEHIRQALNERAPSTSFENRATTSVATEFCEVVGEILQAWKYPDLGAVTFDTEKADLVIGGQDRGNKGKGYRALTYAAFAIGLMKYCRRKGIPHPGFVVLDTPVNPFKGPTSSSPDDKLTDEVKVAFFEYLANDTSGDQVIVMENEEPPEAVRERVTYYQFTKNRNMGRYGFFPPRSRAGVM